MIKNYMIILITTGVIFLQICFGQAISSNKKSELLSGKITDGINTYNDYFHYWNKKLKLSEDLQSLQNNIAEFESQVSLLRVSLGESDSLLITEAFIYNTCSYLSLFVSRNEQKKLKSLKDTSALEELYKKKKIIRIENLRKVSKICEDIPKEIKGEKLKRYCLSANEYLDEEKFKIDIKTKPAPDFMFTSIDGQKLKLSELRSKFVLLHFWDSNCDPCIKEINSLIMAYDAYKDRLEILSISSANIDSQWDKNVLKNLLITMKMNWINAADGKNGTIKEIYKINSLPTLFLINKEGYAAKFEMDLRGDILLQTLADIFK